MSFFLSFFLFYIFFYVTAEFNEHFASFVEKNYGRSFLDTLQRLDQLFSKKKNCIEAISAEAVLLEAELVKMT